MPKEGGGSLKMPLCMGGIFLPEAPSWYRIKSHWPCLEMLPRVAELPRSCETKQVTLLSWDSELISLAGAVPTMMKVEKGP